MAAAKCECDHFPLSASEVCRWRRFGRIGRKAGDGMPVRLERAVEELRKYRHGLKIMSGGFTLSGGEPLMQDRFAVKLFTAAKAMGVHTAVETNGYLGARLSDEELKLLDLGVRRRRNKPSAPATYFEELG